LIKRLLVFNGCYRHCAPSTGWVSDSVRIASQPLTDRSVG
jgi:hypothetical protein